MSWSESKGGRFYPIDQNPRIIARPTRYEALGIAKIMQRMCISVGFLVSAVAMSAGVNDAHAGACTFNGLEYICSGPAAAGTDIGQIISSASPLVVSTVPGFGIDTTASGSHAFNFSATGGLSFSDANTAPVDAGIAGGSTIADAIRARNNDAGALTLTSTGTVNSNGGSGINAANSGTDLVISAATVSGTDDGIRAENTGTGMTNITATGTVTATGRTILLPDLTPVTISGTGIDADSAGAGLTISAAAVTGNTGIAAGLTGSGALDITATGTVSGTTGVGISAGIRNPANAGLENPLFVADGTDLTISVADVNGETGGIVAGNEGTGALNIMSTGTVSSNEFTAISARNYFGTDLTISGVDTGGVGTISAINQGTGELDVAMTGTVAGRISAENHGTDLSISAVDVNSGVEARNFGNGELSVVLSGTIANGGTGVLAVNNGTGLTIDAANVSGGAAAISATNNGTGALNASVSGSVVATTGIGISASNGVTGSDLILSGGDVTGETIGIFANNDGTGALSMTLGNVAGNTSVGILATNGNQGTDLSISAGDVNGTTGISVTNDGTGALNVMSTGMVTGNGGGGIFATNNGTDLTVSVNDVSGSFGIIARNNGTGATSVEVTGNVAGGFAGVLTDTGIGAQVTISLNSGAAVSAASFAISDDLGDATVTVNTGASVTGAVSLGDGSDALIVDGGDISGVTGFDGGNGNDSLIFRNVSTGLPTGILTRVETVVVGTGATITGTGAFSGSAVVVENGGTLGPGSSPGLMQVLGDVEFVTGSTLALELGGLAFGTGYDRLDVSDDVNTPAVEGTATLAAGTLLDIDYFGAFTAGLGDYFDVLVADDFAPFSLTSLIFDFSGAALGSGLFWQTSLVDFGGGREALRLTVASNDIPEPGAALILVFSLVGIAYARVRRTS